MAGFDPFADENGEDKPVTEAPKKTTRTRKTTPAKEITVSENETTTDKSGISLTFKGGTGFDAPWVVLHLGTVSDAAEALSEGKRDELKEVLSGAWEAAQFFHSKAPEKPAGAPNGGGQGGGGGQRPARQAAPGGESRQCEHGDMVFKTGVTKSGPNAGNTWKAFMCPAPQGSAQCKPQFLK